jgi:hypothetical protein
MTDFLHVALKPVLVNMSRTTAFSTRGMSLPVYVIMNPMPLQEMHVFWFNFVFFCGN